MAASTPRINPPPPPPPHPLKDRLARFWEHVTEGMAVADLWAQFKADARSSYRLYSREVDKEPAEGFSRQRRVLYAARDFFWAVMLKLSPAKRVVLLVALILVIFPIVQFDYGNLSFSSTDARMVGGLLLLVLLVLEIADRVTMKRDLEIAREIQLWLVPGSPPQIPGLDVAFVNRPANTVAGDYYDVFKRDAARDDVLLAVADVAGKSLPAALLMATFQAGLRTLSASGCPLRDLVDGLNRYACAHSRGGLRFTTAFLGEFSPVSGELRYVNAGHNAPVLLRSSDAIERLEAGGLPLGIRTDAPYEAGLKVLEAGDLLLIFTDGLVEAINDREEEFGEPRMLASLTAMRGAAADVIVRRLMSDVEAFVGMAHQHDDITCLVARRI